MSEVAAVARAETAVPSRSRYCIVPVIVLSASGQAILYVLDAMVTDTMNS